MELITDLWLPVLVGTIALQIASTLAWMVLPHHFGDHQKLVAESALMELISEKKISAGSYMFPYPDSADQMNSKEHQDRYNKGPRGTIHVYAPANMPLNMLKTLCYFFVTVGTIGYITHIACPPGARNDKFHACVSHRWHRRHSDVCQQRGAGSHLVRPTDVDNDDRRSRVWTDRGFSVRAAVAGRGVSFQLAISNPVSWKYTPLIPDDADVALIGVIKKRPIDMGRSVVFF